MDAVALSSLEARDLAGRSARERPSDTASAAPFFVLGAQRSGTTMLRLMLNAHPRLLVPHESGFITEFASRYASPTALSSDGERRALMDTLVAQSHVVKGALIPDPEAVLARAGQSYADFVDAIFQVLLDRAGKQRWGDKTPSYTAEPEVLWALFPGAKFVHIVRDGRDVAVSLKGISWGTRHIPRLAEDWRWKVSMCHKVGQIMGDEHYHLVRYEDLVVAPEETLRRICEFLGERFHPGMLTYHTSARGEVPAESLVWHGSSVSAPDASKVQGWKTRLTRADQIIYEQIAGPTLRAFDYEVGASRSTMMSRLKNLYYATALRY